MVDESSWFAIFCNSLQKFAKIRKVIIKWVIFGWRLSSQLGIVVSIVTCHPGGPGSSPWIAFYKITKQFAKGSRTLSQITSSLRIWTREKRDIQKLALCDNMSFWQFQGIGIFAIFEGWNLPKSQVTSNFKAYETVKQLQELQ